MLLGRNKIVQYLIEQNNSSRFNKNKVSYILPTSWTYLIGIYWIQYNIRYINRI